MPMKSLSLSFGKNMRNLVKDNSSWTFACNRCCSSKDMSTYEASGKTTARVINKKGANEQLVLVKGISTVGFRLTNGSKILGSTILFPQSAIAWKVKNAAEVNEDSLALLTLIRPKVDIVLLGYGDHMSVTRELEVRLFKLFKKIDLSYEAMTSEKACSTFNFLNCEYRNVVAALIPPSQVFIRNINEEVDGDKKFAAGVQVF